MKNNILSIVPKNQEPVFYTFSQESIRELSSVVDNKLRTVSNILEVIGENADILSDQFSRDRDDCFDLSSVVDNVAYYLQRVPQEFPTTAVRSLIDEYKKFKLGTGKSFYEFLEIGIGSEAQIQRIYTYSHRL